MSQLVGLTGYAGSGKDTAAQGLLDIGWERRAFADPLKACVLALNPIISAQPAQRLLGPNATAPAPNPVMPNVGINYLRLADCVDAVGWDEAKQLGEVRRLLQVFGTEVVRNHFGPDTWVKYAHDSLIPGVDYVFTDARFPNEVEMIHRSGGVVVLVERPGVGPVNAHVSDDIGDLLYDYKLVNGGTIEQLHSELRELVS